MQFVTSKKIIFLIVVMLCFIGFSAQAADISALDFNGNIIGKVIPDGSVVSFEKEATGEIVGHITADGFVFNEENELIGGVIPKGVAISINNSILGKINNDGSVTSMNDDLIGRVLPNGLIIDNNSDVIGMVISPGLAYNDTGNIIGRVSGDGKFYSLSGENNGFVTGSGEIYSISPLDSKINLIGKLISSKIVISSTGNFIGSVAPDGKVMDLKKNIIGSIHANGFMYNTEDLPMGHIVENGYAFNYDGTYLGVVRYNGEIIYKGENVAQAIFGNRVIDKEGNQIGFTISISATVNSTDGKYLGQVNPEGVVVKGRNVVGKIGVSGNVIDKQGNVIGYVNQTGPIFDYLGQLKAIASINGKVFSLEGLEQGYMQKDRAFDYKEKELGKLLKNYLNFDNSNEFIDISGTNTILNSRGQSYKISPYGYIFDETGKIGGRNYPFSEVYTEEGNILTQILSNGKAEKIAINEKGRLTGSGLFVDRNNSILGKIITDIYATDFMGESLGYINYSNLIINQQNKPYAKILATGKVVALDEKEKIENGRADNASISISINGDYLGTTIETGKVKKTGQEIGKISSDGYIMDSQGSLYGKTLHFSTVVTPQCKFLGVVSDTGDVRSFKGAHLGMILANKQVINDSDEVIGYLIEPQAINGKNGEVIGVENALGIGLNYKNQSLGCQDIYGKIRNSQNEIIGQTIPYSTVMDFNDKIIGYTNLNGKIENVIGTEIGYVELDNSVISSSTKEDIGVLFKYKIAFDDNNTYLGRINAEGKVISDSGQEIGHVKYNGKVIMNDGKEGYALYDLYVYDDEGKTIGYIEKSGRISSVMGETKGTIYQGFVIDKKQNLIARGARDYDIRDENNKIVGYLELNGRVVNEKNIEIGKINNDGQIINDKGEVIAQADPLQYYHRNEMQNKDKTKKENKGVYGSEGDDLEEYESEGDDIGEKTSSNTEDEELDKLYEKITDEKQNSNTNIIGIAMKPNGQYLGDINNKNEVINENGEVIGSVDENGNILNNNGEKIGVFDKQEASKPQKPDGNWWKKVAQGLTVSPNDDTNRISNVGPAGGVGPGERYNPRRAAILQQLYNTRRQNLYGKVIANENNPSAFTGWDENWTSIGVGTNVSTLRVDMSNMITEDKPIPAVLARSLISLGKAPVTAIVERNIYADAGRNVIIPAGSRIIGGLQEASNGSTYSAESGGLKVKISWNRIIRPDGISFKINSSETGDAEGRGGGALGYVDEQIIKKYGVPLMGTVATSAMAYMMAANDDAQVGQEIETSKQQAASDARENFLDKMDHILNEIIENKEKIQPVTYVPAGTRIIIYPMEDLWLRTMTDVKGNKGSTRKEKPKVLVTEGKSKQPQKVQGKTNQGGNANGNAKGKNNANSQAALPPPSADGTGSNYQDEDEEEDEGEIDLGL